MEKVINLLEGLAASQRLEQLAMQNCRTALINCYKEDQELGLPPLKGHNLDSIQLHFERHSLVFKNRQISYPYIDTIIGLYIEDKQGLYLDDLEPVGDYQLITRLDGEIEDDYLVLYEEQQKE
jgi:hypothetical protein